MLYLVAILSSGNYLDIIEIKIAVNGDLILILSTKIDGDFVKPKTAMHSDLLAIYRNF